MQDRQTPPGTSVGRAAETTRVAEALARRASRATTAGSAAAALESRLLRMWSGYEDALTQALEAELGGAAAAARAWLTAMMLIALVRSLTSVEVLADVRRHHSAAARRFALRQWTATAERTVSCLDSELPARTR